jgi:PAS domain S-box-containing protein
VFSTPTSVLPSRWRPVGPASGVETSDGVEPWSDGESALRRKLVELEAVFAALPDGVLVVDTAGQIVDVNRAMLGLLGLERADLACGSLAQVVHARATRPDGSALTRDDLGGYRTLRSGEVTRVELLIRRASGESLLVETIASPIRDGAGGILGAVVTGRDVTATRRRERAAEQAVAVEDALADAEDARTIFEILVARCVDELPGAGAALADWCAAYEYDPDGTLLRAVADRRRDVSTPIDGRDGRSLRPADGQSFAEAAVAAGHPLLLADLTEATLRRELGATRARASLRQLDLGSIVALPIIGREGPIGALVLGGARARPSFDAADVELAVGLARRGARAIERALAADALTTALRHLKAVLDALPDGVVITDRDGQAVLENAAARRMLAHADGVEGKLEGRDVEVLGAPLTDDGGVLVGRLVLYRDLTASRHVERLKDELATTTGREVQAGLAAISAYAAQSLRRARQGHADRSIGHGLEVILRNARQLTAAIGELLDATKPDVELVELDPVDVGVLTIVEQAIDQARAMTTVHRLRIDAPAGLPTACWDPDRVRRALVNVLGNAIKHWPEGGQIGVRVRPDEQGILISVRDRGPGIPPESLERVFERFYRVPQTSARKPVRGSGLGLSVVKAIVLAHGGTAWAESSGIAGEGTTVHLLLPWRPPATPRR